MGKQEKEQAKVYVLRVAQSVDVDLVAPVFELILPGGFYDLARRLRLDDRLFLRVWEGGATGKARLAKIIEVRMPPTTPATVHAPTVTLRLQQTWGWSYGKYDDSLDRVSWSVEPDVFPVLGQALPATAPAAVDVAVP